MLNLFPPCVAFYIKTSHIICKTKYMTGFYIKCNTVLKWLKTNIFTVSKVTEVHLRLSNIYDEFLLQK